MDASLVEVNLSENICRKIKDLYFADVAWSKCQGDVAGKLNELKYISQRFYCGKPWIEVLKELSKYSTKDLLDAFDTWGKKTV